MLICVTFLRKIQVTQCPRKLHLCNILCICHFINILILILNDSIFLMRIINKCPQTSNSQAYLMKVFFLVTGTDAVSMGFHFELVMFLLLMIFYNAF